MNSFSKAAAAVITVALCPMSIAGVTVLNFEGISATHQTVQIDVLDYYNGGAASNGAVGPDLGVQFVGPTNLLCLNTPGVACSGSSAGPGDTSNFFAISLSQDSGSGTSYMNVGAGFVTSLSFGYTMPFNTIEDGGYVEVFGGLDGSGKSLGKLDLSETPSGVIECPGYNGSYCPLVYSSIGFSGTGRSVVFQAPVSKVGSGLVIDNIAFTVPEPQGQLMWLVGLGACLAGASLQRRRRCQSTATGH